MFTTEQLVESRDKIMAAINSLLETYPIVRRITPEEGPTFPGSFVIIPIEDNQAGEAYLGFYGGIAPDELAQALGLLPDDFYTELIEAMYPDFLGLVMDEPDDFASKYTEADQATILKVDTLFMPDFLGLTDGERMKLLDIAAKLSPQSLAEYKANYKDLVRWYAEAKKGQVPGDDTTTDSTSQP